MRKILAKDIAPFTMVLAKMELKETVRNILSQTGGQEKGELASGLIMGVIENYHKAADELIAFLAKVEGKTPEEIASLPVSEYIALVTELFSEENLPFFKSVVRPAQQK